MKTFLVYNTSYFGDTILTDALCRNLKRLYPESRLVFVSNKPFTDISRYMDGVDEVWTYDKWGIHKGLAGWYKFYKEHKNQHVFDAAFVIYGNERGILLSKFLGAKKYTQTIGMRSSACSSPMEKLITENGSMCRTGMPIWRNCMRESPWKA